MFLAGMLKSWDLRPGDGSKGKGVAPAILKVLKNNLMLRFVHFWHGRHLFEKFSKVHGVEKYVGVVLDKCRKKLTSVLHFLRKVGA